MRALLASFLAATAYSISPMWTFKTSGIPTSPAVDSYGWIYFASSDRQVRALYPNGTLIWNTTLPGNISSSSVKLSPNEATLVFGSDSAYFFC